MLGCSWVATRPRWDPTNFLWRQRRSPQAVAGWSFATGSKPQSSKRKGALRVGSGCRGLLRTTVVQGTPWGSSRWHRASSGTYGGTSVPNIPKVLLRAALHGGPLPPLLLVRGRQAEPSGAGDHAAPRGTDQSGSSFRGTGIRGGLDDEARTRHSQPGLPLRWGDCWRCLSRRIRCNILGKTNTTITSRFYGTASSAPASVFGRPPRGAQAHLGKLRVQKAGSYEALQMIL